MKKKRKRFLPQETTWISGVGMDTGCLVRGMNSERYAILRRLTPSQRIAWVKMCLTIEKETGKFLPPGQFHGFSQLPVYAGGVRVSIMRYTFSRYMKWWQSIFFRFTGFLPIRCKEVKPQ